MVTGAHRELAHRVGRAADDRCDLRQRDRERFVQDVDGTFRRRQRLEDREQREVDLLVERHTVGRIDGVALGPPAPDGRFREPGSDVGLPLHPRRFQPVEREVRDDSREPCSRLFDVIGLGALGPDQGILDDVLGVVARTEHAVRDADEVFAVLGELLDPVHAPRIFTGELSSIWVVTRPFARGTRG